MSQHTYCSNCGSHDFRPIPYGGYFCSECGREYGEVDGAFKRVGVLIYEDFDANKRYITEQVHCGRELKRIAEDLGIALHYAQNIYACDSVESFKAKYVLVGNDTRHQTNEDDINRIREGLLNGKKFSEIARELNRAVSTISRLATQHNLQRRK